MQSRDWCLKPTLSMQWTIHKHSQLILGQRYNSGPFYVGGQPW